MLFALSNKSDKGIIMHDDVYCSTILCCAILLSWRRCFGVLAFSGVCRLDTKAGWLTSSRQPASLLASRRALAPLGRCVHEPDLQRASAVVSRKQRLRRRRRVSDDLLWRESVCCRWRWRRQATRCLAAEFILLKLLLSLLYHSVHCIEGADCLLESHYYYK